MGPGPANTRAIRLKGGNYNITSTDHVPYVLVMVLFSRTSMGYPLVVEWAHHSGC